MNHLPISVIVLCHNTLGIELCLGALTPQLSEQDELIVLNDHSSESFLHAVEKVLPERGQILSVPDPGGNRSQNRNLGARAAHGDILVFADGDIIVCERALSLLRDAFCNCDDIACVGTEHGMKFDMQQAQLVYGEEDYLSMLGTLERREHVFHSPLFADWRGTDLSVTEDKPYYWLRFYTSFCAVRTDRFWRAGGFDESFHSWGAEDIDLGYRLSLEGGIGYLPQLHCIHVPHPRDSFRNELTNRQNIYHMLEKYLHWYFEVLLVFEASTGMLRKMTALLARLDAIKAAPLPIALEPGILYVDAPCRVTWLDASRRCESLPMLGMAIPCRNKSFDRVILSNQIFIYPAAVTARILQESLRVGQCVEIHRVGTPIRLGWSDMGSITGTPFPRICRYAEELFDFTFLPKDENTWTVHSEVYATTPDPWGTAASTAAEFGRGGTVLLNLSSLPDGEAAERFLLATGHTPLAVYHFSAFFMEGCRCLLCESIPGDFSRMNSKLAYCVSDLNTVSDAEKWISFRAAAATELILDCFGCVSPLRDCSTKSLQC